MPAEIVHDLVAHTDIKATTPLGVDDGEPTQA